MTKRSWFSLSAAFVVLCLLPWFGAESLSPRAVFSGDAVASKIFWDLRLPRLGFVLLAGGVIALIGAIYQALFHNALAEPYVLGISSAVALGSALAEAFGGFVPDSVQVVMAGLLAAGFATGLLLWVGTRRLGRDPTKLVLFGMGMNFVLSSILFLVLSFRLQHLGAGSQRWLFGQIPWMSGKSLLTAALLSLPFLAALILFARKLDALAFGDAVSRTMGVDPVRTRMFFLVVSSFLLAGFVAKTGSIGFVGLVVPHAASLLFRPPTARSLLVTSFLLGGVFLGLSDTVSRALLPPFEFPIGTITTLVGGPLFLYLLAKR